MKLKNPVKLSHAARLLGCEFSGQADHLITGMNEIHRMETGDLNLQEAILKRLVESMPQI